jgi:hypothetical protein
VENADAGDDVGFHSGLRAKNASQMFGVPANDRCGFFIPAFGDPAALRHKSGTSLH